MLLTDLPRAFSCLCHDLLIVKLHSYGLNISPLELVQDYLSNRMQGRIYGGGGGRGRGGVAEKKKKYCAPGKNTKTQHK